MADIVKFAGASLPSRNLGGGDFRKVLIRAKEQVGVGSGGGIAFLKLGRKTGEWTYGQDDQYVQEGSRWAVNPNEFEMGFVAWKGGRPIGKKMRNIKDPNPVREDELPPVDAKWDVNVGMKLMCVHGEDAGGPGKDPVTVEYTATSYGGKKAWTDLLSAMYLQSEENESNPVPVIELLSTHYMHPEWGKTYNPVFKIHKWVGVKSEEAASTGSSLPEQKPDATAAPSNGAQPQRRRAAAPVTDVEEEEAVEAAAPASGPADPVQRRRRRAAAS